MSSLLTYHECLFILPIINAELANTKHLVSDLEPGGPKTLYQEYLDTLTTIQTKIAERSVGLGA